MPLQITKEEIQKVYKAWFLGVVEEWEKGDKGFLYDLYYFDLIEAASHKYGDLLHKPKEKHKLECDIKSLKEDHEKLKKILNFLEHNSEHTKKYGKSAEGLKYTLDGIEEASKLSKIYSSDADQVFNIEKRKFEAEFCFVFLLEAIHEKLGLSPDSLPDISDQS